MEENKSMKEKRTLKQVMIMWVGYAILIVIITLTMYFFKRGFQ